jgi:hypothetical protein
MVNGGGVPVAAIILIGPQGDRVCLVGEAKTTGITTVIKIILYLAMRSLIRHHRPVETIAKAK